MTATVDFGIAAEHVGAVRRGGTTRNHGLACLVLESGGARVHVTVDSGHAARRVVAGRRHASAQNHRLVGDIRERCRAGVTTTVDLGVTAEHVGAVRRGGTTRDHGLACLVLESGGTRVHVTVDRGNAASRVVTSGRRAGANNHILVRDVSERCHTHVRVALFFTAAVGIKLSTDSVGPCSTYVVLRHPEEGAAVTVQLCLQILQDFYRCRSVNVGASQTAVVDAEAEHNFLAVASEAVIH